MDKGIEFVGDPREQIDEDAEFDLLRAKLKATEALYSDTVRKLERLNRFVRTESLAWITSAIYAYTAALEMRDVEKASYIMVSQIMPRMNFQAKLDDGDAGETCAECDRGIYDGDFVAKTDDGFLVCEKCAGIENTDFVFRDPDFEEDYKRAVAVLNASTDQAEAIYQEREAFDNETEFLWDHLIALGSIKTGKNGGKYEDTIEARAAERLKKLHAMAGFFTNPVHDENEGEPS